MMSQEKTRTTCSLRSLSYINCCEWIPIFSSFYFISTTLQKYLVWSENQSSVAAGYPLQWQAQNEKHSRPWHIELGATRQQVVLSLLCGPWALEWNGHRCSLLWDEWRRLCCFWSSWVAEYWGTGANVEILRSTCPPNFTVEVSSPP